EPFAAIATLPNRNPPRAIVEIPADSLFEPALECRAARPPEITLDLRRVHRITSVVARTIRDEADEIAMPPGSRPRTQAVEEGAGVFHALELGPLAPAADIVALADPAMLQHRAQSTSVIVDMEPIADLVAPSIDRQRLLGERLYDDQRDQLLGELVGPVVVRAVGGDRRQAKGGVPGAHQVIG